MKFVEKTVHVNALGACMNILGQKFGIGGGGGAVAALALCLDLLAGCATLEQNMTKSRKEYIVPGKQIHVTDDYNDGVKATWMARLPIPPDMRSQASRECSGPEIWDGVNGSSSTCRWFPGR